MMTIAITASQNQVMEKKLLFQKLVKIFFCNHDLKTSKETALRSLQNKHVFKCVKFSFCLSAPVPKSICICQRDIIFIRAINEVYGEDI
jgi:hypothetical protein